MDFFNECSNRRKNEGVSLQETFDTKPAMVAEEKQDVKMAGEEEEDAKDSTNGSPLKRDQAEGNQLNGQGDVDHEPAFKAAGGKFRGRRRGPEVTDMFAGVDGFKLSGNNKKMEIKLPQRSEEFFLAWDVFDYDGL